MLGPHSSLAGVLHTASRALLPTATLLVWAAVAFSAVTWGLRWSATTEGTDRAVATAAAAPEIDTAAAARSLGAAPAVAAAAPNLASRFQLQGVMAGDASQGAALMAVDGKAAKPYRVGSMVADGLWLQSVQGRRVSLGPTRDGAPTLTLELPPKK